MGSEFKHLVTIHVVKHLPMGLGVETENGQYGIIRIREISWDQDQAANWRENYPVDWSGAAYPLSSIKGQVKEFSLRLVESDPWERFSETIEMGELYEGVVTGIVVYGAFIEIAPGITGLLHRSQIPAWVKGSPIEVFWPGDRVFVKVQEIKYKDRKILLAFPESIRQVGQRNLIDEVQPLNRLKDTDNGVDLFLKQNHRRKNYLIVEDDPDQSMTISSWLRHLGQRVDVAVGAEDALAFLEKTTPDMAFIDVGLPRMNGLELSKIILEKWPQIQIVITTDWAQAESVMDELEELLHHRAELLIKPLLPEDLISVIRKAGTEQPVKRIEQKDAAFESISLDQPSMLRSNSLIKRSLLDRLRRYLGFDLAIIFSINKSHRQVSILECSGDETLLNSAAISQLIYSPVRDVAEDQGIVMANDIHSHGRDRFRYLLELYPHLTACIGVPITSRIPSDFALFALDRHSHQISPEQKIYVEAIALVIGTHLEQENFNERSVLIQRSALIGHLTRAMVHEINNLVGPLHSRMDNLQFTLKRMDTRRDLTEPMESEKSIIADELVEIQKNIRRIINTTRMFGRIAAKGKNEILRIDEIIDETIHFMRDISDRSHVKIIFTPPEHLLVIRSQAAALEQVLLNVLLNAVQQIAEQHPDSGGWIHVKIDSPYEMGGRTYFRILIDDNGPGIHVGLWDRIFEAGYTTREDGSGIGLYISWNLMEEMEGRIYVRQSHILSGTTFAMEIPYHL